MSFKKYFIHFRHYRLQNYWPYCFSFGNLKFPMAVVHSDLYIGSLSILDMGQADKNCFSLVSQTEFFLICPLRPCHAFCESFGHDKSYENVFTWGRPKNSVERAQKIISGIYCWCAKQRKTSHDSFEVHMVQLFYLNISCMLWMYFKIVLPWNMYEATFLIAWEGSCRTLICLYSYIYYFSW